MKQVLAIVSLVLCYLLLDFAYGKSLPTISVGNAIVVVVMIIAMLVGKFAT